MKWSCPPKAGSFLADLILLAHIRVWENVWQQAHSAAGIHKALPALVGATVMLSTIRQSIRHTGSKDKGGEIKQCHQDQRE